MKFKSLVSFSDSTEHYLFGKFTGVAGTIMVGKLGDNLLYLMIHDGTKRYVALSSGYVAGWETGVYIAAQWDIANNIYDTKKLALCIDGVYQTPTSSNNATDIVNYPIDTPLSVLNNANNAARFANGIMEYLYIFNTVKTEVELKDIYENPYAMMKNKASMVSVFFPTLIGGNPWYHNAQQM
jgi:hypothetical protein